MKATIKATIKDDDGEDRTYEATWDGVEWASESEDLVRLLNIYSRDWKLKDYHPSPVIGVAIEVAESLKTVLKAEFVKADEIDYSQYPEGTIF
ncbi:MAG: hypothetical protein AB7U82_33645 [Blastocatellales bacterium]